MTSTEPIRDQIKRLMRTAYDHNGKLEWTVGEILDGLNALPGDATFTRQHVTNGLTALKSAGIAGQTSSIPHARGGARYWALLKCLELATAPESSTETTEEKQGENTMTNAIPQQAVEAAEVSNDRKPRHDDGGAHVIAEVAKLLGLTEKQFGIRMTDLEKLIKSAKSDVIAASGSAPDGETLEKAVTASVNSGIERIVKCGNVAMEAMAKTEAKLADDVIATLNVIVDVLRRAQGNDNAEIVGYRNGFADGWAKAMEAQDNEKILAIQRAGYSVTEVNGNVDPDSKAAPKEKPVAKAESPLEAVMARFSK